jgi:hypothetical protein
MRRLEETRGGPVRCVPHWSRRRWDRRCSHHSRLWYDRGSRYR